MKRHILYGSLFLLALGFRLFLHYQTSLIPGINGGYYVVQIRSILNDGFLGFPDMPLYFYFLTAWTILIASISSWPVEEISMQLVKIVDSIALLLSVIPMFYLFKRFKLTLFLEGVVVFVSLFSISAWMMLGDFQKNAFAIPFLFAFALFGMQYLENRRLKDLRFPVLFFILIALSHFGVFVFTTLWTGIMIFLDQKKKAFLWLIGLLVFASFSVFLFDPNRAQRLVFFVMEVFQKPTLFHFRPPAVFTLLYAYTFLFLGLLFLRHQKDQLSRNTQTIVKSILLLIVITTFPLLDSEYSHRLSMMLFVPLSILIAYLLQWFQKRAQIRMAFILILITIVPLFGILHMKRPSLTDEAFQDLGTLRSIIKDSNETIVLARHGLEWWANWALHTKIGNTHAMDASLFERYAFIYILEETKNQERNFPLKRRRKKAPPAFETPNPKTGKLIEVKKSNYFKIYEWKQE